MPGCAVTRRRGRHGDMQATGGHNPDRVAARLGARRGRVRRRRAHLDQLYGQCLRARQRIPMNGRYRVRHDKRPVACGCVSRPWPGAGRHKSRASACNVTHRSPSSARRHHALAYFQESSPPAASGAGAAVRPEVALLGMLKHARFTPRGRSPPPSTRCTSDSAVPGEADLHAEPAAERRQKLHRAPAGAALSRGSLGRRAGLARRRVRLRRRQRQPQRWAGGRGQHAQAARAAQLQHCLPLHPVARLGPRARVWRLGRAAAGLRRPAASLQDVSRAFREGIACVAKRLAARCVSAHADCATRRPARMQPRGQLGGGRRRRRRARGAHHRCQAIHIEPQAQGQAARRGRPRGCGRGCGVLLRRRPGLLVGWHHAQVGRSAHPADVGSMRGPGHACGRLQRSGARVALCACAVARACPGTVGAVKTNTARPLAVLDA